MFTLTLEQVFQFFYNRGIEIENRGNAFDTLQSWRDKLSHEYPHSATFYAEEKNTLVYISGSNNTKVYVRWCPEVATVIDCSADEDHWIEIDVEVQAAIEGRPFDRWRYIIAKRKMLRELI